MFSLDLVAWKKKKEQADRKAGARRMPTKQQREEQILELYGKTTDEMYEDYLSRVHDWTQQISKQQWIQQYAQDAVSINAYVPRQRERDKELGLSHMAHGKYKPHAKYKGGGECVERLDKEAVLASDEEFSLRDEGEPSPTDKFDPRRDKSKEIQPPMRFPKQRSGSDPSCKSTLLSSSSSSPSKSARGEPQASTAEMVFSPVWRKVEPTKWMTKKDFTCTVTSQTLSGVRTTTLTGNKYGPSILSSTPCPYCPTFHKEPINSSNNNINSAGRRTPGGKPCSALEVHEKRYFNSMLSTKNCDKAAFIARKKKADVQ